MVDGDGCQPKNDGIIPSGTRDTDMEGVEGDGVVVQLSPL